MTKFIPLVDTNTKHVLQWTMIDDQGVEHILTTTRAQWKSEDAWTTEELHQFFSLTNSNTVVAQIIETTPEPDIEDTIEILVLDEQNSEGEKKSSYDDF